MATRRLLVLKMALKLCGGSLEESMAAYANASFHLPRACYPFWSRVDGNPACSYFAYTNDSLAEN